MRLHEAPDTETFTRYWLGCCKLLYSYFTLHTAGLAEDDASAIWDAFIRLVDTWPTDSPNYQTFVTGGDMDRAGLLDAFLATQSLPVAPQRMN